MRTTITALALALVTTGAYADITEDCIVEGTVDKQRAERLGTPVFVEFHSAKSGEEARCNMNRPNKSHRVQFKAPGNDGIENAPHGSRVKYRYTEENNQEGTWELLDVSGGASS